MAVLADEPAAGGEEKTLADFENATLGILSGSSFDPLAKERFPNAKRQYYSLVPDMILAVEQGKIDAYISETTYVAAAIWDCNLSAKTMKRILQRAWGIFDSVNRDYAKIEDYRIMLQEEAGVHFQYCTKGDERWK